MKIEIESTAGNAFIVKSENKTSGQLGWDELLGLIAALTMPDKRPCVHWMKDEIQFQDKQIQDKKATSTRKLIAIGYHDTYVLERLLSPCEIEKVCVRNKKSPIDTDVDLSFNQGVIIDSKLANINKESWSKYINCMIDLLGEYDHITTYNVYD